MANIADRLDARFGASAPRLEDGNAAELAPLLARRSCRSFSTEPVSEDTVRLLVAAGLSAPTKSDLQQADVIRISDPALRRAILEGLPGDSWMLRAPEFLVVCGNGQRLVSMFERTGRDFPNDHFDALFNASVDAALVLGAMVDAAAILGLGTCPISQIRNRAAELDRLLELPPRVFPVAGLCLGWPAREAELTPRLGLDVTLHENRFDASAFEPGLAEYEERRARLKPMGRPRAVERFGTPETYGWEEDKTRQYSEPQRTDFGAYLRDKGFDMS